MTTESYRISPSEAGTHVGEAFEQHYEMRADQWRQERINDLVEPVTFAAHYLLDAMEPIFADAVLAEAVDLRLPSGWHVQSLDLGRVWRKFLMFTSPADPADGYILACDLAMEESEASRVTRSGVKESIQEMFKRLRAAGDERSRLFEENLTTEVYLPENSKGINNVTLFRFEPEPDWSSYTRQTLEDGLCKAEYVQEVFGHRPQRVREENALLFSSVGRGINAKQSMAAMPLLAEFASRFDPAKFAKRMHDHANGMYYTIEFKNWPILQTARRTFQHTAQFPGPAFTKMIEEMWKRGAALDVASRMDYVKELTDRLIELGHVTSELEYDCNDGRTRVYAREISGVRGLYVEYEDMATGILFKDGDGRVIIDNSEYAFGTTKSTVLDLIVDGRKVEGVVSACPYDNETAGILNRALVDIESAHCHLVPDPNDTPAPTRGKKR